MKVRILLCCELPKVMKWMVKVVDQLSVSPSVDEPMLRKVPKVVVMNLKME